MHAAFVLLPPSIFSFVGGGGRDASSFARIACRHRAVADAFVGVAELLRVKRSLPNINKEDAVNTRDN